MDRMAKLRCDRCHRVLPRERQALGLTYPLHMATWNFARPDPDDQRRVLHMCSEDCAQQLGLDLVPELAKRVRGKRRHPGSVGRKPSR